MRQFFPSATTTTTMSWLLNYLLPIDCSAARLALGVPQKNSHLMQTEQTVKGWQH